MKFSEEYKKSAENINPDRQTIDRMKAAVLKELQEHPDAPAQPLEEPKKPLPLRRIAYIGGAVAACAAITVAAVNLVPSLKASNAMISSGAIADSSASAAEIAGNETAAPEFLMIQNAATAGSAEDIAEEAAADEAPADEAPADDAYGFDNGIAGTDGIIYNDSRYENENTGAGGAWVIVRSPQGWLTADGERYDAVKNAAAPADISVFYWANSPVENKDFCLVIDGDMLYLFDDQMNYLGGYKKR
ncbi:MAG: hypothetical protein KH345_11925 [Eubacterium sp.]|nr:hypothetical protein [Eubacterium sp.]